MRAAMSICQGLSLDPDRLAESAERAVTLARKYVQPPTGHIDRDMTDRAAYNAAAEGIVMLENYPQKGDKERNCCPLPASAIIALTGTLNGELLVCGGGSACVRTDRNTNLLTELRKRFADVRIGLYDEADTWSMCSVYPGRKAMTAKRSASIRKNSRRSMNCTVIQTVIICALY